MKNWHQRSFQRPGHFINMKEASLSDTVLHTRREGPQATAVRVLSMAIRRNGRKWFVRLHNFNSNSENYISPVDGIKTNLAKDVRAYRFKHAKRKSGKNGLTKRRQLKKSFFWFLKVTIYLWSSRYLKDLWTERSEKWGMRILKENSYRTALD